MASTVKMKYTTPDKQFTFELEARDNKELLEQLSALQDIFEQPRCTNCGKRNFRYLVREVEGDKYYEIQCKDCGFKLQLSQSKKGNALYPRRKNQKTGKAIGPKGDGWHKWGDEEAEGKDE